MRPGQNKRMRGRPTNNRRGPNPLTRSYESNGPDVKIRGNAHHVAEKYLQLARDAHTGGDPVAAENYLQHAEHYFRLIAAAQAAQLQAQSGAPRAPGEADAEDADDEEEGGVLADRFASPSERAAPAPFVPPPQPYAPQPNVGGSGGQYAYAERQPYEGERQGQPDRNNFQPRQDRPPNRHGDRGHRQDRPYQDRQDNRENRGPNDGRQREFRPYREPSPRDQIVPETATPTALPSFITAAPRIVVGQEEIDSQPQDGAHVGVESATGAEPPSNRGEGPGEPRFPGRGRRRRLRSPYGFHGGATDEEAASPSTGSDETPLSE